MRVQSLVAHAFGPFRDRRFEFAPGLNVLHGPNESGKSSLHAALYAAICGMRRGKGRQAEDQEFETRYRPWNGGGWKVSAVIELADGRHIEMVQDLDDKARCKAFDADLGRDCTDEIQTEGTPDAARWLGLDRRAFLTTACVRQAELLSLQDEPQALQVHMQRAAASSEGSATAAVAILRVERFQAENVGVDRTTSTKPLRQALVAEEAASTELDAARAGHEEFTNLLRREEELVARQELAARELTRARAARAVAQALRKRGEVERARELAGRFPAGPPPGTLEDEDLATEMQGGLQAYDERVAIADLEGETSTELREQLNRLRSAAPPAVADSLDACADVAPAPEVLEARTRLDEAQRALEQHGGKRLAPEVETMLQTRVHDLDRVLSRARRESLAWWALTALLVVGGLVVLFALPSTLQGRRLFGAAFLAFGFVCGLAGWRRGAPGRARLPEARGRLEEQIEAHRKRQSEWEVEDAQLRGRRDECERGLRALLVQRGIAAAENHQAGVDSYLRACELRGAAERLGARIEARDKEEAARAAALARRLDVEDRLLQVARRCGIEGADTAAIRDAAGQWSRERRQRLEARASALREWDELQRLLAGRSLAALESDLAAAEHLAADLATGLAPEEVATAPTDDAELERRTEDARLAATDLAHLGGQIDNRAGNLLTVADAEEKLRAAREELARMRRLDEVLSTTRQFLEQAQERVHRDIAPGLAETVRRWLPAITAGRYAGARVDPQSLDVQVQERGGEWRQAALLSHGTAEQVYLLLRVALVQHLTQRGEVCPLLLDDPTVQFDRERKLAVLEALRELSRERQIILFSQEDEVRDWAEANLHAPEASSVDLAGPTADT